MASIHKDIPLAASPADVWAAVRDFGSPHTRLVPGFVLDARLEGDTRIVTFHNGNVARELLVDCDDEAAARLCEDQRRAGETLQRLVQVIADGEARSRMTWIVDVLPNEIAPYISRPDGSVNSRDAENTGTTGKSGIRSCVRSRAQSWREGA